jgi:predicted HicB family RNase H-like nuclease
MKKRLNLEIDKELLENAKIKAIKIGISLSKVITQLLTEWVK